MKSARLIIVLLAALCTAAVAQSNPVPQSEAQKSFGAMKGLAGTWEGKLTTTPPDPEVQGKSVQVTLRVTSSGNAVLHEIRVPGREDDPITMFYIDTNRLTLTHYCDAGNRPRMAGDLSPDGKTLDFKFIGISGNMHEHMHHSTFHLIDADHHSEDWTFMMGDTPVIAHMDLQRVK